MPSVQVSVEWEDWVNRNAVDFAENYTYKLVTELDETNRELLRGAVGGYYEQGWTLDQLEDKLFEAFGPVRAEMIAITEVTRASVEGERNFQTNLEDQTGMHMEQVWETSNDEIVCEDCEPLNGRVLGDGWTEADGPPAHPRCRCWVNFRFPEKVEEPTSIEEPPEVEPPQEELIPEPERELSAIEEMSRDAQEVLLESEINWVTAYAEQGWWDTLQSVYWEKSSQVKHKIASVLGKATRTAYEKVNAFIHQWAITSNDENAISLSIQKLSAKLFGTSLSEWQTMKMEWYLTEGLTFPAGMSEAQAVRVLKTMYADTQAALAKKFGEDGKLLLFRGVKNSNHEFTGLQGAVTLQGNAIESWSANYVTAKKSFAGENGTVFYRLVNIDQVVGTAQTGFGCLDEAEFVVLGGNPYEAYVFYNDHNWYGEALGWLTQGQIPSN